MNNFEEKLNKIKVQKASESEKNSIWLGVVTKRESFKEEFSLLSIFNLKKHMIGALIALLILGGGGGVVAASNASVPGDTLFGVDRAVEQVRLGLADDSKKNELRVRFAEERIVEAKEVVSRKSSVNVADVDLSAATLTEVEVDVFTNETTVKLEASDRHYGFVTAEKDKDKIVDEIESKYKLSESSILAVLSFEVEDRASRADDKGFLNSAKSEKEDDDLEDSLNSVSELLGGDDLSADDRARLDAAFAEILSIVGVNGNAKIRFEDDNVRVEIKDGEIRIKDRSDDDDSDDDRDDDRGHGNDDDRDDDDNPGNSSGVNVNVGAGLNLGGDVREDENEVFCRGEWRDPEDCDKNDSDDDSDSDNDDDDNSGSGNDDDDDNDSDNDDDSEDDDNDNSGHGGGDNDEEDED